MANEYLYGAYGHIGETVAQSAVQAGTTPVYIGTAPVNLVRGFGKAGDDGGPDAGGRRDAGGDGESHGQGQCQNAHGDARREVLAELGPVVARQAIEELGAKGDFHGTRS